MVLLLAKLFARNLPVFISSSRIQLSIHVLFREYFIGARVTLFFRQILLHFLLQISFPAALRSCPNFDIFASISR